MDTTSIHGYSDFYRSGRCTSFRPLQQMSAESLLDGLLHAGGGRSLKQGKAACLHPGSDSLNVTSEWNVIEILVG